MAEYEKSIPFKNWTTESFKGIFGAALVSEKSAELVLDNPYLFEAGGTYSVPQSQALHFARQLAIRELHRIGTSKAEMLTEVDIKANMDKCFPVKPSEQSMSNTFERIDEVKDVEAKASAPVKENKTDTDVQNEDKDDEEDNADDVKNNAGAPVFKRPVGRSKTRDAAYVK